MTASRITRRDFVRGALAVSATGLLSACRTTSTGPSLDPALNFRSGEPLPWSNWAGNHVCHPAARWAPGSEDELVSRIAGQLGTLRPVGAGHSFTPLVPTDGTLVATDFLSGVISTDDENMRAEVWAGTRLHQLGPLLEARDHALPNLPDINYQTLAGATATSTHGTGVEFGSLSSRIDGLVLVTPSGELLECDRERNTEAFHAACCSLGALGVVTRLTLRTQPSFRLIERTGFDRLDSVLENVEQRAAANRHFELYAFPHSSLTMVVETNEGDAEVESAPVEDQGATEALRTAYRRLGRIPGFGDFLYDRILRSETGDFETVRSGPSFAVLAHDRVARFREMEYTMPAEAGPACLREILAAIRERKIPVIFPIEYRYVKRDDVWLSMFHERDGCTISIHQFADEDYRPYFDEIEPIFWEYDGRPHWGKIHSLGAAQLAQLYPRWKDFTMVRAELDPTGKMLNDHLRGVFGTESTPAA